MDKERVNMLQHGLYKLTKEMAEHLYRCAVKQQPFKPFQFGYRVWEFDVEGVADYLKEELEAAELRGARKMQEAAAQNQEDAAVGRHGYDKYGDSSRIRSLNAAAVIQAEEPNKEKNT